ncbi:MAG: transglutaminase domain-containing protein, partial [Methanomicrobiales archaeon]|nr:transglutaminase domain-containing protein [Methanomicrobiales archaeon]
MAGSTRTDEKFREWTRDQDLQGSLVSIFEHIRDIPYSLMVPAPEGAPAGERLLAAGRGSCGAKHYLLTEMFRRLGVEVVYATFPFLWNNPDLHYPADLRELSRHLPVAYHLACRARINHRWILVDATWDLPLGRAGFPVNEHWDGQSDTLCAVKPLRSAVRTAFCRTATNEPCRGHDEAVYNPLDGELDHEDERDRVRYTREKTLIRTQEDLERIRMFFV